MKIGIDFGTCFSCVAISDGPALNVDLVRGKTDSGIPTLFAYDPARGKELFGDDCATAGMATGSNTIRYIKRTARQNINAEVVSGGKKYTSRQVIKSFLGNLIKEIKSKAEESDEISNPDIEEITVTAPVGIMSGYMTATDYNGMLFNILKELLPKLPENKIHILHEPVAAALSYLHKHSRRRSSVTEQTVLVFDLGGGTLDVSLVEYKPNKTDAAKDEFTIIAKGGDLALGGNDWDNAWAEHVLSTCGIKRENLSAAELARFSANVTRSKHDISTYGDGSVSFNASGKTYDKYFREKDFNRVTSHLFDKAMALVKKTVSDASLPYSKIDKIVLVGGGSNMPEIKTRMKKEFGAYVSEENIIQHEPSKAIAKGAALFSKLSGAIVKAGRDGAAASGNPVADIVGCTYGFESTNSELDRLMIYNLIYKGTPYNGNIEVSAPTNFHAKHDSQTQITFDVYESDCRKDIDDTNRWMDKSMGKPNGMTITLDIPKEYIGNATGFKVTPSISINSNGIIVFILTDLKGKRYTVPNKV